MYLQDDYFVPVHLFVIFVFLNILETVLFNRFRSCNNSVATVHNRGIALL